MTVRNGLPTRRRLHLAGRRRLLAAVALTAVGLSAGCTGSGPGSGGDDAARTDTVAMLLVRSSANRYIANDQPFFEEHMLKLCPKCKVEIRYAEQDPKVQSQQMDEVLDLGAKVVVLNAAEARNAAGIVAQATSRKVPVIAYDRLAAGDVDYYVSFDNARTGQLQGEHLLTTVRASGDGEVVWIDGPASDVNAGVFSREATAAVGGQLPIAARFQIPGPGWNPDQVRAWLKRVLPTLRDRNIAGVLAPGDGIAGVAVDELAAAGFPRPAAVTGQDAEVSGLQRVMTGQQTMTVYKPFRLEARKTAELAYQLLRGQREKATETVDNGTGQIPAFLVAPVLVTRDNLKETVFKDGYVTRAALCAGQYAEACEKLGID